MRSTRLSGLPLAEPINEVERVYLQRKRAQARIEVEDVDYSATLQGIFQQYDTWEGFVMARPLLKSWVKPNQERMRGPAIVLPPDVRNMEIKNHMFQQLPRFYGLAKEDVMGFLNEIENFINNLPRPGAGITDDQLRMKVFAMGLGDRAKAWLGTLEAGSLKN